MEIVVMFCAKYYGDDSIVSAKHYGDDCIVSISRNYLSFNKSRRKE
jgi:hypothetical protein